MITLARYVEKKGSVRAAAKAIGIHWTTLSRHLHGHNAPHTPLYKSRLKALKIDADNYPGGKFRSKFSPSVKSR